MRHKSCGHIINDIVIFKRLLSIVNKGSSLGKLIIV